MKRLILLCSLFALALTSSAQTTGTWNKVTARDTFVLSGRQLAEIVYVITSAARNNESPTAKAVYDYVIGQRTFRRVITNGDADHTVSAYRSGTTGFRTEDTTGVVNLASAVAAKSTVSVIDAVDFLRYKRGNMQAWYIHQKAVSNGDGTTNNVLEITYNLHNGGTVDNSADAVFGVSMEPHWIAADGDTVSEWHIFFNDQKGGVHRPITGFFNYHKPEENSWGFSVDKSYFNGNLANKRAKVSINMTNASLGAYPLEVYKHKNTITTTSASYTRSELDSVTTLVVGNYNTGGESPQLGLSSLMRWSATQDRRAQFYLGLVDMTGSGFDAGTDFVGYYQNSGVFKEAFRVRDDFGYFGIKLTGGNQPTQPLHVNGNARITGAIYDSNNDPGTSGQVLSSTGTTTDWVSPSGVTGSGASPQVATWSGTSSLTGSSSLLWESSILKVKNNNALTGFLNSNAQQNIQLLNTDATNNNWASITNYTSAGTVNAALAFQNVNQSTREAAVDIWAYSGASFLRMARFKHDGITLDRATTISGAATLSSTSAFNGAATFSAGITANTVASNFNSQVNVGSSSAGNIQYNWNDYSNTSAAASNAFAAIVLKNRNATANNWTALEWDSQSGQIAGSMAMQYLDHTNGYGDIAFHTRGSGTGFAEAFRITSEKRVGVGTASPASKLDVEGGVSIGATYSGTTAAPTNGVIIEGSVGIGNNSPGTKLHTTAATGTTTPILRIENTGGDADFFVANATPEGAITGSPGDIALRTDSGNGKIYVKGSGTGNTGWLDVSAGGGVTDHGALTGLGDDDHTQYLLLAGRATGQVATGGTASGDDLTLRSTTDATKGDVIVQDQGGNLILGGGTTAGELRFMEPSGSGTNYTEIQCGAMAANQSYVWPTDAPSDGEILAWHTGGLLSWDPAGGAAYYQTLQIGGTDQTQRAKLNISPTAQINVSYSDDAGNNRSNLEFSIADDAIGTVQIDDGSVSSADLNQMGATTGQILKWDGSFWAASNFDDDGNISDITGNQNNYTPTTWSTENTFTIGANNLWVITGFGALPGGTERTFINTSGNAIIVASGHPDSDPSNRVQGPCDYIIGPYGGSISMRYSNTYSKWYVTNCTYNPGTPAINGAMGHYYNATVGATTGGDWGHIGFGLAGGANGTTTPTATLPAGWQLGTSTSPTGTATLYFSKTVLNPTFYSSAYMVASAVVYIPTLSDGTQTYTFQFGLVPSPSSTTLAVNNSIGFRYSNGINSGEWEGFSRNNSGTESTADLNIAVAADTKYILTMVVNKEKTEARFFINGTYTGRVTTNLPNNVAVGTRAAIVKSVGTTSRTVTIPTYTFYTVY